MKMRRVVLVLGLFSSSCGRDKPCVTPEIPINGGLTFMIGGDPSCTAGGPAGSACANSPGDQGDRTIPEHMVRLEAFLIDQTEVTNAQYRHCVDEGVCQPPRDCLLSPLTGSLPLVPRNGQVNPRCLYQETQFDDLPVVAVGWDDARAYCKWVGKDLPSEAQWERAAVGARGFQETARKFPWGDASITQERAHVVNSPTCTDRIPGDGPRGIHDLPRTAGQSPEGVYDLSGNVREWVLDDFDQSFYCSGPGDQRRRTGTNECIAEASECARTANSDTGTHERKPDDANKDTRRKVVRGGAFCATVTTSVEHDCDLHTRSRSALDKQFVERTNPVEGTQPAGYFDEAQTTGFRCARLASAPAPSVGFCPALPLASANAASSSSASGPQFSSSAPGASSAGNSSSN